MPQDFPQWEPPTSTSIHCITNYTDVILDQKLTAKQSLETFTVPVFSLSHGKVASFSLIDRANIELDTISMTCTKSHNSQSYGWDHFFFFLIMLCLQYSVNLKDDHSVYI